MKTFKTAKGTELPLIDLKGKDYLQVAHRLVWFREEHPDWSINTEYIQIDENKAIAKATVSNELGKTISTAHKCEDKKGFADFAEKAETGAIGRALASCGYGTQFAPELDEHHRIVDSPMPSRSFKAPEVTPAMKAVFEKNEAQMVKEQMQSTSLYHIDPPPAFEFTDSHQSQDIGGTVFMFGKNKGKTFAEVGMEGVSKSIWGAEKALSEGAEWADKVGVPNVELFIKQAKSYLNNG